MKFIIGPMPEDEDFEPEKSGWTFLKEPRPSTLFLIALFLAVLSGLETTFLWVTLTPVKFARLNPLYALLAVPCIIPLHELIHALVLPVKQDRYRTFFGFWPARFAFYIHYTGPISRTRYMTISIFPYLLLSILPILICASLQTTSYAVAYAGIGNSFACGADFATFLIILLRVPPNTTLRQQGYKTWWKPRKQP